MDQRDGCFPGSFRRVENKRKEPSLGVKVDTPVAEVASYCGERGENQENVLSLQAR